ncbi:MAG: hydroxymethylglutaryl-CoA lyase [Candidatus Eisenbacteria bacterium]|nr:hydroxymethylglutaryl-CoA lyase [Candidatus Eisenbacteria bacterium]
MTGAGSARTPKRVRIVEVGPRDGLQNEAEPIPVEERVRLVARLAAAGLPEVEVGAFVSPRWVPQMAATEEVARALVPREGTVYTALVPNEKGLERALACGIRSIAVFTAASETFNRRNTNASIAESLDRFRPVLERARVEGLRTRGYLSTAFVCPYEGGIDPAKAVSIAASLLALGCDEVSVGDTIGAATPREVEAFLAAARALLPIEKLAFHFHDTYGMGIVNVATALDEGAATFDSSAGGLGGCPYAPGAGGNLATEDLVYFLRGIGIETGVDLDAVVEAAAAIEPRLGHALPSKVHRALRGRRRSAEGAE